MSEIIDRSDVPESLLQFVVITVNGTQLAPDQWDTFVPRQNDRIGFWIRPAGGEGGKSILRLVALVAIAIAAPYAAGALNGVAGLTTVTAAGTLTAAGTAVAAGIAVVGSLLVSALIPPPSLNVPQAGGLDQGESYFITSQSNSARPYQLVPIVYGRMKMVGNLATSPQIFSAGQSSIFTALYDFGLGACEIDSIKAGDTQIEVFSGRMKKHIGAPQVADTSDPSLGLEPLPLELVNYPLKSEDLNIALNKNNQYGVVGTAPNSASAVAELYFPQGVAYYDKNGNMQRLGVTFRGEYRPLGGLLWEPWPEGTTGYARDHLSLSIDGNTEDPNGNDPPSVQISVPTRIIEPDTTFFVFVLFGQDVWNVDAVDDLRFFDADTGNEYVGMEYVAVVEEIDNRKWRFEYKAGPDVGQYFIATNLQAFTDAPPPNGIRFPDIPYQSENFLIGTGSGSGGGDGGDGGGGDTGGGGGDYVPSKEIYDRTEGNETFVKVTFLAAKAPPDQLGDDFNFWLSNANYKGFEVWKAGQLVVQNTGIWQTYAGVIMSTSSTSAFGGFDVTIWLTLKNADASPSVRHGGLVDLGRSRISLPNIPNWDGSVFANQFSVYGDETTQGRVSIVIPFPEEGEYEIKITRIGDTEDRDDTNQYFNSCYWARIASRGYPFQDDGSGFENRRGIVNLKRQHTMLELSFEASETIQGNVQQISAVIHSRLRWHDGVRWKEPVASSNPAWVVADLLTGYNAQQIRHPYYLQDDCGYIRADQLDIQSFIDFAAVCDEEVEYEYRGETITRKRYEVNTVIATEATMMETVQNILGMARAQLILGQNGLLQVMMDVDRGDQVRQLFTPSNSWGFQAERVFPEMPDGFIISFVSPELGYNKGEITVLNPNVDPDLATNFERLETYGCTNWHQAAWWGGYQMAQALIRLETFTLNVMAESLVIQRGDVVEISQDAARLGGGSHLIVNHPQPDVIVLSEAPYIYDDPYYTIRTSKGIVQGKVVDTDLFTVTLDKPLTETIYASDAAVCVIGQKDLVTKKYIVNSIRPKADLTAELSLVVYDERMYLTDLGVYPEWDAGGDGDPQDPNYGKYQVVDLTGFSYLDWREDGYCQNPYSVARLEWRVEPDDGKVAGFEIQWNKAGQTAVIGIDNVAGSTRMYEHVYRSNSPDFGAGMYTVIPITSLGYRGLPMTVYVNKAYDRIAPPRPKDFYVVQMADQIRFYWKRPDAIDIGGYNIYISTAPSPDGTVRRWFNKVMDAGCKDQFAVFMGSWNQMIEDLGQAYQFGAIFFITAIDTSGNESLVATFDGLADGPYQPCLVEPFDLIYADGDYDNAGKWGVGQWNVNEWGGDGANGAYWLIWKDCDDPYGQIAYYEIRFSQNENAVLPYTNAVDDTLSVPLENVAPRKEKLNLRPLGFTTYESTRGTFFIRAVDKMNQAGPWNRCGQNEKDVTILRGNIEQTIEYSILNREPYTLAAITWEVEGTDVWKISNYKVWLYTQPRPPAGRSALEMSLNTRVLLHDGPEQECEVFFAHLNEKEQHYGVIGIEAHFADSDAIASNILMLPWDLIYDTEPPPEVTGITATGLGTKED